MTGGRAGRRLQKLAVGGVVTAIAFMGAGCTPPESGGGGCGPDAVTSTIHSLTNASRAANGLGQLGWNGQLACLASNWSASMGAAGAMSHSDLGATLAHPDYAGYSTLGENVLTGPGGMSADSMHNAWMNSPLHRANILSPSFSSIGIGVASAGGKVWATETFGG